ncbi:helix-turn-helix domain-containing protein [Paeniroseomonas aquatica]|uniref:helix-turn-helix domain-containing protein n=1 Tax=Paeniroseomonas aquatica TaxID=373043 RepID=UPI00360FFD23
MHIREVLAQNLRRLRRDRCLSQEELAHRAEIDRTYVSALERGSTAQALTSLTNLRKH